MLLLIIFSSYFKQLLTFTIDSFITKNFEEETIEQEMNLFIWITNAKGAKLASARC